MKIEPINGQVLLKPLKAPEKTAGGLHLPESGREKPSEGEVIAVARDATEEVAVGDRVIYQEFGGTKVTVGGENFLLIPSDELLIKYVAADAIPE